ncbi:addiction module protein [Gracilimonas mengyeensis]|uniref:Putative addiction module component, TIGR02574 family n=1 Tax=Gracilimonas mengyeensis TaxID=1302730 RepID=A0A521EAE5_9BACT|nr:addiction module protein [Gracilimonas mengyeensis]SMO80906.1 putative addiction module component, TIGR02574 family [Gracilimonas mengyeensis]
MITDFKEIQDSALELDEKHRAELAKKLINSLEKSMDEDIEQAWIDEIKRRKAEIKSGKVASVSGQEVHKAARELLKK